MNKQQYIRVKQNSGPYRTLAVVEYELGATYKCWNKSYRFIKSTSSGYNFLNLENHKCLLRRAMYPIKDTAKWITKYTLNDVRAGKLMFTVPGVFIHSFIKENSDEKTN